MIIHKKVEELFWRRVHDNMRQNIGNDKFSIKTSQLRKHARQEWDLWQIMFEELEDFANSGL